MLLYGLHHSSKEASAGPQMTRDDATAEVNEGLNEHARNGYIYVWTPRGWFISSSSRMDLCS